MRHTEHTTRTPDKCPSSRDRKSIEVSKTKTCVETVIGGGSGDDEIHLGGDHPLPGSKSTRMSMSLLVSASSAPPLGAVTLFAAQRHLG